MREISFLVPPLPEQTAIVRFLDHADRRIRRYIRAKQKLIALLEEQKQAIIHQAVTGQIDVRTGQPYPSYKPSGVEWLGMCRSIGSRRPRAPLLSMSWQDARFKTNQRGSHLLSHIFEYRRSMGRIRISLKTSPQWTDFPK